MSEVAPYLTTLFKGNQRVIAVWDLETGRPKPVELKKPLKPQWLQTHLDGERCLGFYLMNPADDTVTCACLDFDDHDGTHPETIGNAKTVYRYLQTQGRKPLLEVSQSGTGMHIWLFFREPIPAYKIRAYLALCLKECECPGIEIYPRQDSVQHLAERLGNFVRYPLWGQSHFLDNDFNPIGAIEALTGVIPEYPEDIPDIEPEEQQISFACFETDGLPARVLHILNEEPTSLLARRWGCDASGMRGDGSRSALAQAIVTELVRYMVPTPEIEAALKYWCHKHDYERPQHWHERTVLKAYDYSLGQRKRERDSSETLWSVLHKGVDALVQGVPIIPTGLEAIDASMKGIALGEFGLVCGRPSQGKTAFTFEWLDHAAKIGFNIEYISLEMSYLASTCRFLPRMGVDADDVPGMAIRDVHEAIDAYQKSQKGSMYFSDRTDSGNDLESICAHIEESHHRRGVDLFAVDYAELIYSKKGNGYEGQVDIFRTLAQLTRKLNIALVLLVQLKRPPEGKSIVPQLHHLKFGGEQEADLVMACQWWWMEDRDYDKTLYTIYGLKNKNKGIKEPMMNIAFHAEQQRFSNPANNF